MQNKKFLSIMILFLLGSLTLGAGLGAGYAIAFNMLPEVEIIQQEAPATVSSVRINPLTVPVDPREPTIADIIPKVKDSVVSISVFAPVNRPFGGIQPGAGSGFIFYQDDEFVYIATNNHVIEHATEITISLDDNENVRAQVVGRYAGSDLAVLAVSREELYEKGVPFSVATLGDSDVMRMGDTVIAIGNAMGEGQTVTQGIVSATGLTISVSDPGMRTLTLNVMQTDAAVNRGNSGGPLLNQYGEVIGIVTAKLMGSDIEGMGYALPINEARIILEELKELGSVRQAFIGIIHEDFSEFMRDLFNMPYTGVLVRELVPDSPAEAAGIEAGDLIIYFNNVRINGTSDLVGELAGARPGDDVVITVYRDGATIEIPLTLGTAQW